MPQIVAAPAVFLTNLAIGATFSAASMGLNYLQAAKAKQKARQQVRVEAQARALQRVFSDPATPRWGIFGTAAVGGLLVNQFVSGTSKYMVIVLGSGVIDGIDRMWINGTEVLFEDVNGIKEVVTPPFNSSGTRHVAFELIHGHTDQAASVLLSQAFPAQWLSTNQGKGIAYVVVRLTQPAKEKNFNKIFGAEGQPEFLFQVRGHPIYDPRNTAHDSTRAVTWSHSRNAALCLMHYLTAPDWLGYDRTVFSEDSIARVADVCDRLEHTRFEGVQPLYRMAALVSSGEEPGEVIQRMLDTFGGSFTLERNGTIGLTCRELDTYDIEINETAIHDLTEDTSVGALYEYTSVKARFSSAQHKFAAGTEEADPWIDATATARVGKDLPFELDLQYVSDHFQARRLMKRKMLDLAAGPRFDLKVDYNALPLFRKQGFKLLHRRLGINVQARIEQLVAADDTGMLFDLRCVAVPSTYLAWDADTEEGTAPPVVTAMSDSVAPATPSGLSVVVGNSGGVRAMVSWVAGSTARSVEADWKLTSSSTWTAVTGLANAADNETLLTGLTAATSYDFRVRFVDDVYGATTYATLTFTATATAGTTGALGGATAVGNVLKVTVTVTQSSATTAAFADVAVMDSGVPVNWTGATQYQLPAAATDVFDISKPTPATYDVYVRSVGLNGDVGAVTGPLAATVTAAPTTPPGSTGGTGSGLTGGSGTTSDGGGTYDPYGVGSGGSSWGGYPLYDSLY
jgi:hypothetical protein